MTGIFDSGRGGITALWELRRICPAEDIIYFADSGNAPYGPKPREEILLITERNIRALKAMGADRVLIACCTASTVYESLAPDVRCDTYEIITPAARIAAERVKHTVGVISTEATYKSAAFPRAISEIRSDLAVVASYSPELVELVESGCSDGDIDEKEEKIIKDALAPFEYSKAEALILGCTHFTHIKEKIEKITGIPTINPSLIGAAMVSELIDAREGGKTVFI